MQTTTPPYACSTAHQPLSFFLLYGAGAPEHSPMFSENSGLIHNLVSHVSSWDYIKRSLSSWMRRFDIQPQLPTPPSSDVNSNLIQPLPVVTLLAVTALWKQPLTWFSPTTVLTPSSQYSCTLSSERPRQNLSSSTFYKWIRFFLNSLRLPSYNIHVHERHAEILSRLICSAVHVQSTHSLLQPLYH